MKALRKGSVLYLHLVTAFSRVILINGHGLCTVARDDLDHVASLRDQGATTLDDCPATANMQWQTVEDAKAKDRWE